MWRSHSMVVIHCCWQASCWRSRPDEPQLQVVWAAVASQDSVVPWLTPTVPPSSSWHNSGQALATRPRQTGSGKWSNQESMAWAPGAFKLIWTPTKWPHFVDDIFILFSRKDPTYQWLLLFHNQWKRTPCDTRLGNLYDPFRREGEIPIGCNMLMSVASPQLWLIQQC